MLLLCALRWVGRQVHRLEELQRPGPSSVRHTRDGASFSERRARFIDVLSQWIWSGLTWLTRPDQIDARALVSFDLVRCGCSLGGVSFNLVRETQTHWKCGSADGWCSGHCDLFFSLGPGIVGGNVESPLDLVCASLVRDALEFGIKHYVAIDAGHAEAEVDQWWK